MKKFMLLLVALFGFSTFAYADMLQGGSDQAPAAGQSATTPADAQKDNSNGVADQNTNQTNGDNDDSDDTGDDHDPEKGVDEGTPSTDQS